MELCSSSAHAALEAPRTVMLTDAGNRAVWLKVCVAISWLSASRRCMVVQLLLEPPHMKHVKGALHLRGGAEEVEARGGFKCGCKLRVLTPPPTHRPLGREGVQSVQAA